MSPCFVGVIEPRALYLSDSGSLMVRDQLSYQRAALSVVILLMFASIVASINVPPLVCSCTAQSRTSDMTNLV